MKKKSLPFFICAAAALVVASSAHAANITWDVTPGTVGTGDSAITGGVGTWNTTLGNWTTDGGANNFAWSNTTNATDTAVFQGTGGAVTVSGTINASALTFSTTGYSTTTGTIAFGGSQGTITNTTGSVTIGSTNLTGTGGLLISGAGKVTFASGNKAITGGITVSNGATLQSGGNSGTAFNFIANSNDVNLNTSGKLFLAYQTGGNEVINGLTGGASSIVSTNNIGVTNTLTVNGGTATFGGTLQNGSGTLVFAKTGTGTQTLSGANTYTGATSVTGGTLLVNGSTHASSAVSVSTGGILGGTGNIGGTVTINSTGVLSAGASVESLESGALTMVSGSSFLYEATNNTATGADLMIVNGTLSLTNVTLDLTGANLAGAWLTGDKLTLLSYTGADETDGFAGYTDDAIYTFGTNQWQFDYNDLTKGNNFAGEADGSKFVTMTLVPEPSVALLGGLGVLALLRRRRN